MKVKTFDKKRECLCLGPFLVSRWSAFTDEDGEDGAGPTGDYGEEDDDEDDEDGSEGGEVGLSFQVNQGNQVGNSASSLWVDP